MNKKFICQFISYFLSLAIAFLIVNTMCYGVYWLPQKYFQKNLATDAINNPNSPIIEGMEGFSILHTDSFGYINKNDLDTSKEFILCIGSSDTLAKNVSFKHQYCEVLENKLASLGFDIDVYNMGSESQGIDTILRNYHATLGQFENAKIIVIETSWLPEIAAIENAIEISQNKTSKDDYVPFDKNAYNSEISLSKKVINSVSSLPFPRLLYSQINRIKKNDSPIPFVSFLAKKDAEPIINYDDYLDVLDLAFKELKRQSGDRELVLLYNPYMHINSDGKMEVTANEKVFEVLEKACNNNDIIFTQTGEENILAYENENKVYRGFNNTLPCSGHINKYGHKIIGDKLYEVITNENLLK